MIGDWINMPDYYDVESTRPLQIDIDDLAWIASEDGDVDIYSTPISLTKEILVKNGFLKVDTLFDGYELRICDSIQTCEILVEEDTYGYMITIRNGNCGCSLIEPSVHEFQHALRLCGLNELADNFKI